MRNFLKIVCRYRKVRLLGEIFDAYDMRADEEEQIIRAVLFYTALPSEEQKKRHGIVFVQKIRSKTRVY